MMLDVLAQIRLQVKDDLRDLLAARLGMHVCMEAK